MDVDTNRCGEFAEIKSVENVIKNPPNKLTNINLIIMLVQFVKSLPMPIDVLNVI